MQDASVTDNLDFILARQREAFLRERAPSLVQRRADLTRLRSAVIAARGEVEQALRADFGYRSRHETAILEISTLASGIAYLHRNLRAFMRPSRRHVVLTMRPGRARVEYQPLGVIGIMAPWNFPVALALMPLATALAAGNRAMIKPSELAPATADLLVGIISKLFPSEQVAVVTGDAEVGAAFSRLPFDHLIFTGSTAVGRAVMRAASEHLVPVTLELGGKSPVIVARGHAVSRVANSIAKGKLANGGQICIAPDYALVHESDVEAFVAAYDKEVATLYPSGPTSDDYTAIISERHFARLGSLLDDARSKGAQIIPVGRNAETAQKRPHTMAPTVVIGAKEEMRIIQEEIFGPILPIIPYRDIGSALSYINARGRPLALYYFGSDGREIASVLGGTTSGNVTINDTLLHYVQDSLPFGGVGPSGMGTYHGVEGFRRLSHAKGVFVQARWNAGSLTSPPFGRLADALLNLVLR